MHAGRYTGLPEGQEAVGHFWVPPYVSAARPGLVSPHLDAASCGSAHTRPQAA